MAMTLRFRFHGRCETHPRFNPARDGLGGIKGGCHTCHQMWRIWVAIEHAKGAAIYFDGARISETEARRDNNHTTPEIG